MEKSKNYKIVASDLDGTLLGKDQSASDENLGVISELHRHGVEFVPAIGRALGEIPCELMQSEAVRYIITSRFIFTKQAREKLFRRLQVNLE